MRRLLLLLVLLIAPTTAFSVGPTWPLADMPRFYILGEGNGHFSVDGFYFLTKENYDTNGLAYSPAQMEQVRYTNIRLHGAFGFSPKLSLFAQTDMRGVFMSNAKGSNISDDENYGFGDAFLGARWLVYRSSPTDRVYPSEWSPGTVLLLAEGTWLMPLYKQAKTGKPPLGNQSSDLTGMGRLVWYVNDWLGLAGNAGYTYRSASYSPAIPWGLRADLTFLREQGVRFWADLQAIEATVNDGVVLNSSQPDPIQSGSLLFKSDSPALRTVTLGAGILLSKEMELAAGGLFTLAGVNAAKGFGGALGLTWRPYQVPELKYDNYRDQQVQHAEREVRVRRQRMVLSYGLKTAIIKVSSQGNYFQIPHGKKSGVKAGDYFQIFAAGDLSEPRRPLAVARVQVSRAEDSFLRVEQKYNPSFELKVGQEAQRVIFQE